MSQSALDFLNLFVESPGDLLYFLVVIAMSQASLFMTLGHRSRFPYERTTQRYVVATFALVGVWVLLLAGAMLPLLLSQNPNSILPPLERLAYTVTLLMLSWAFLSADNRAWGQRANVILIISIMLSVGLYILTAIQWRGIIDSIPVFNLSTFAPLWSFLPAFIALISLVLIIANFKTVVDAPIKTVFFLLITVGNGFNLFQFMQGQVFGNYLGSARLVYVAALTMLPLIIYRLVVSSLENSVAEVALAASQPTASIDSPTHLKDKSEPIEPTTTTAKPSSSDSQSVHLLRAMGMMMDAKETSQIPQQVVKAVVEVLRVDIGILITIQDANYADIIYGYNRAQDQTISGISLSLDEQPTLVNALERHAQRALFVERNVEELDDFYRRIDIDQQGTVYIQPLTKEQELVATLIVGLPFQQRELTSSETELLKGVGIIASNLLALSFEAREASILAEERAIQAMIEGVPIDSVGESDVVNAHREMEASLQLARDQINQLSSQVSVMKLQLDEERRRILDLLGDTNEDLSVSQRISAIFDEQEGLRTERDSLARELLDAETTLTSLTVKDGDEFGQELTDSLQREYESLVSTRDQLHQQIDDLRAKDKTVIDENVHELLSSMYQETARLETERNELSEKLTNIQSQLSNLGIDGDLSTTQVIAQFSNERNTLLQNLKRLQNERDILLQERGKTAGDVDVQKLRKQIQYLASDREAFLKLRERMRSGYKELLAKFETGKEHRNQLRGRVKQLTAEMTQNHIEQANLRQQIQKLQDERSNLLKVQDQLNVEIETLRAEVALEDSSSEESQALVQEQLSVLQTKIRDLTEGRESLELELNYAQTALADALNQNQQIQLVQVEAQLEEVTYKLNEPEMFVGLVQELRTPMTSIVGYVDLLLGESAGIIGEMQRNFLQRVSINIQRLTSMIDDLVKMTQLDAGTFELQRLPIDLISLIEDAITNASNQFREKGLVVNLSLEDSLPHIPVDRDGMQQIIGQLLTNAYLVSPSNSELFIRATRDEVILPNSQTPQSVVMLVVEDRGGGILLEDIPRVFARKYKAENPLIEGLGDTGVGMSIAKAFTEAHGGYMWVESEIGIGSSFKVALPIHMTTAVEES